MRKQFKLLLESGLAVLCGHIKAIRATAEQAGSAVASLAESTATSLEEIDGLLGGKQDKSAAVSVTIPTSGWTAGTSGAFKYYYDITAAGVTSKDRADVNIPAAHFATAVKCGMSPDCETLAGKIRLRAVKAPSAAISATYRITKGA